jgi:hypothetical protein
MKGSKMLRVAAGCFVVLFAGAVAADAAELRLRCEKRSGRSKISVDGRDVPPGDYMVTVTSGANTATDANTNPAGGDEVEFDFDSNVELAPVGETPDVRIAADFIQGSVCATITGPVTTTGCEDCKVK